MDELTILEMQNKMRTGELSARELCEAFVERIEQIDRGGPRLNAVIELNPDALAIAEKMDQERKAGQVRGPLHGIPILIKDNIDTADRMQTTAGSLALAGWIARQDAEIVRHLREAGVVLLGKTNLSEWANFRSSRSVSGWSSRGGLTRNPYALDRSACGSSSGSGAAAAANLCAAAVGTETDGSIICPAQTNGIVGIKPTLGLLSGSGIIPIAHSQDTAGPMARRVADAALLLGGLKGDFSFLPALERGGLKGARIGITRGMAGSDERLLRILDECVKALKECGAVVLDPVELPNYKKLGKHEVEVLHYEFKQDLNQYLSQTDKVRSMAEVIRFNEENSARVMPYFGQEHMLTAQKKGQRGEKKYQSALDTGRRLAGAEGIDAALRKDSLDALVTISGGPAWSIDLVNGDATNWDMESTTPAAVAGYPHITVPAGYLFGLPVGLSFFSTAWQEAKLIQYAYAFEQGTKVRRPPRFLEHAEV
jgi:amidase